MPTPVTIEVWSFAAGMSEWRKWSHDPCPSNSPPTTKTRNSSKLRPRGDVLQYCALLHAKNIDQRLQSNGGQCDQVAARDIDESQRKNYLLRVQRRKSLAQIGRESHAERCDCARGAYGEIHPSIKKSCCIAVGLAHVNVLASRVGKHAAQFGKGEAGQQRHAHAYDPNGEKKPGMPCINGDVFCREKNARTDDAARQQQNGVSKRESADEFSVTRQYEVRA